MRRKTIWAPFGLVAVALIAAACGSSSTTAAPKSPGSPSAGRFLRPGQRECIRDGAEDRHDRRRDRADQRQGLHAVLVRPGHGDQVELQRGCVQYWPPVKGPATAGPGVTGTLTTITRSDGSLQAAYDGHPLYTYVADTAPGQAKGNGINLSGGVWHEVTVSGGAAPAQSPSSGSGGGGY